MDAFKKRILNPQKIAVYERWGVVLRNGDRLSLSPLGWELARRMEPEVLVFRAVLDGNPLYRSALDWAHKHRFDRVIHPHVIAYWKERHASSVCAGYESAQESAMKINAICFFHLCQAAELGTVTLGKRGQPARLLIDREELEQHIGDSPSLPPATTAQDVFALKPIPPEKLIAGAASTAPEAAPLRAPKPRVFISCADRSPVVEQVQAALAIAEFECEVVERGRTGAALLTERARLAMRSSMASVIILTADDRRSDETGRCWLKEEAAMVIGASCAFSDNQVALLREENLAMPDNLSDLKQFEFQVGGLSWESGLQLTQAIKEWMND